MPYKVIPVSPVGRTSLGCASCDHSVACDLGDLEQAKNTAFAVAMMAGAIWVGFWWTKPKKNRS